MLNVQTGIELSKMRLINHEIKEESDRIFRWDKFQITAKYLVKFQDSTGYSTVAQPVNNVEPRPR